MNGLLKLGQPVPDSNFPSVAKSGAPQPTHRKTPRRCSRNRMDEQDRSVALPRRIAYWSGVSCAFHSASVFTTFGAGARSATVGLSGSTLAASALLSAWACGCRAEYANATMIAAQMIANLIVPIFVLIMVE